MDVAQKMKDMLSYTVQKTTDELVSNYERRMGRTDAMRAAFRDIIGIMFGKSGLAVDYAEHFLTANGTDLTFPLSKLLGQDRTVRDRVLGETWRRALKIKTDYEKRATLVDGDPSMGGIDPTITLFQSNFSSIQWWGALGTFPIRMTVPKMDLNAQIFTVTLEGLDTYRWAPGEDRISRSVHKLADSLIKANAAKNFGIYGERCFVTIDRSMAKVIEAKSAMQINPRGSRGIEGTGFSSEQVGRFVKRSTQLGLEKLGNSGRLGIQFL